VRQGPVLEAKPALAEWVEKTKAQTGGKSAGLDVSC
jgi:hypothetical protein